MSKANPAKGVKWDLSSLYSGINDPKLEADKKKISALSDVFVKKYKGKIGKKSVTPALLLKAIKDVEILDEKLYIYLNYASYLHSQDTKSPKIGAFYQEANEFSTEIASRLLWFSLAIQQLDKNIADTLLKSPSLKQYSHYFKHLRDFSKFRKSLPEEEIMTKLSLSGEDAFIRFYDEVSSSEKYKIGKREIGYAEAISILKDDPSTKKREDAAKAMTAAYKANDRFYTYVINTLLLGKKTRDEIRGYKYPQQGTFLRYEVDPDIVKSLVKTVEGSYPLSERYYKIKSKLLNRKLFEWDRYSSIYHEKNHTVSWNEAKEIVLTSFSKFDTEFSDVAKMFFENGWIDAEISPSKKGGAFCSYCVPSKHPFILLSFTGSVDDVMTLAHELGHGIHAYLSRINSLQNFFPSTATAEIASVFGESLVFDYLYENAKSGREKMNLLSNKIQGSFATIFRQTSFYNFESQIHEHRRKHGELSTNQINNYFQAELQKMFGKGLTLTPGHAYWWMPVLHFYHYNFYVFTYAFGEALTLSLYQKYRDEGDKFVKEYKNALRAGGSQSPKDITSMMGVDIGKRNFWKKSIELLEEYVDEFQNLANGTN